MYISNQVIITAAEATDDFQMAEAALANVEFGSYNDADEVMHFRTYFLIAEDTLKDANKALEAQWAAAEQIGRSKPAKGSTAVVTVPAKDLRKGDKLPGGTVTGVVAYVKGQSNKVAVSLDNGPWRTWGKNTTIGALRTY